MPACPVIVMPPCPGPVRGRIRPPGSKSITNRALVCAALAQGTSRLSGVLDSQDTRVMQAGLTNLGFHVAPAWERGVLELTGSGGTIPAATASVDCAASGTTMRFLSALCALGHGEYTLDGTPRMRQRPIDDLLASLRSLGVEARAESPGGCPPVRIRAGGIGGGTVAVHGATSSQFASGLALAAPCSQRGLTIEFSGRLVSLPYLEMTRRVMQAFGATCEVVDERTWHVPATGYTACDYRIEPDASAASYFFAAAAITGGSVTVEGLSRRSMQGDVAFCDALARMGCAVTTDATGDGETTVSGRASRGIEIDMNAISDTVPTLAAVALFAGGPTTIRNVAHIRDKETDRIGDLCRELRRLGALVEEFPDGLRIEPRALHPAEIATYDDHRMAMSLALTGLVVPDVRILDPGCVAKTFPDYWRSLARLARLDPIGWPEAWRP